MTTTHNEQLDRLGERHFRAISEVVDRCVGIQLPASKRTMVEGRLRKRVRALGLANLQDYGAHLFDRGGLDAELIHLIDCVTTNKTDFFREPTHFDFLRHVAIPELVRQRGARRHEPCDIKVWSAAASTGAEAYTISMVLQDMVAAGTPIQFSILGTDVSTEVLKTARAAIYPVDFVAPVSAAMRQRYVLKARDPANQTVRISPELRRKVRFERLNLMDESYPIDRDVDVILCRNVLIYFDKPTQATVISRLVSHLRPGGYLMLGHSESMAGYGSDNLSQVIPTIYQTAPTAKARFAA